MRPSTNILLPEDPDRAEESAARDVVAALTKPLVYSSPGIHGRRKRILREARRLIAERGMEGYTIRELCRRAEVAPRTLYNAFGNKERLLAIAVREAYEDFNRTARYRTDARTLIGMLDRLVTVNRRNFEARNYTRAVAALYFSPTTHHDIWEALHQMAFVNLRPWLEHLESSGELQPWVGIEEAGTSFANMEYATINDWAQGRVANSDYLRRLVQGFLALVAGVAQGKPVAQAQRLSAMLHACGELPNFAELPDL